MPYQNSPYTPRPERPPRTQADAMSSASLSCALFGVLSCFLFSEPYVMLGAAIFSIVFALFSVKEEPLKRRTLVAIILAVLEILFSIAGIVVLYYMSTHPGFYDQFLDYMRSFYGRDFVR